MENTAATVLVPKIVLTLPPTVQQVLQRGGPPIDVGERRVFLHDVHGFCFSCRDKNRIHLIPGIAKEHMKQFPDECVALPGIQALGLVTGIFVDLLVCEGASGRKAQILGLSDVVFGEAIPIDCSRGTTLVFRAHLAPEPKKSVFGARAVMAWMRFYVALAQSPSTPRVTGDMQLMLA